MSDILDAPGVPCIECERTICGEPHWIGDVGPICDACSIAAWATFEQILMERLKSEAAARTNEGEVE